MRKRNPKEVHWSRFINQDPYGRLVEGIITSVSSQTGYAGVRLFQYGGEPITCRISFQSVGVFCNARVMPNVGDMVLVAFGSENRAEIVSYICPAKVKQSSSEQGAKQEEEQGGYWQLIKASKDGEEWEVKVTGDGKPLKRKITFREIFPGEFNYKSGSVNQIGGAEVYGDRTGTLHLLGGPGNIIKLVLRTNEINSFTDLFRRGDGDSSSNSTSITERLGSVKRNISSGLGDIGGVVPLEKEVTIPKGGLTGGGASIAGISREVQSKGSAKEYLLRIKSKVGFGSSSRKKNMIEIKLGDVIDNQGKEELNPDPQSSSQPVKAKLSVYDDDDPSGKLATHFKVDDNGNIYVQMNKQNGKNFTLIGALAKFRQVFDSIDIFTQDKKTQVITGDYKLDVSGSMSITCVKDLQITTSGERKEICASKYTLEAPSKITLSSAQINLGSGQLKTLVTEDFLYMFYNTHTHGGVFPGPSYTAPPTAMAAACTTMTTKAS